MSTKQLKVSAIKEGTVIDHIPAKNTFKVVEILSLENEKNDIVSVATNLQSKRQGLKGIIKIGGKSLTKEEADKIAIVAPNATINIIKDYKVIKKLHPNLPETIKKIIKCSNPQCISNNEPMTTRFSVIQKDPLKIVCDYCERRMKERDIVII